MGFPVGCEGDRDPLLLPPARLGEDARGRAPLFIPILPRDPIPTDSGVIASDGWAAID